MAGIKVGSTAAVKHKGAMGGISCVLEFDDKALARLEAALDKLPIEMQEKAIRPALNKAKRVWVDNIKATVPDGPGVNLWGKAQQDGPKLKDSIKTKIDSKAWKTIELTVTADQWYARFVELGHIVAVPVKGKQKVVRLPIQSPANPFMRKAFDASKGVFETTFVKELQRHLDKAFAKMAKSSE